MTCGMPVSSARISWVLRAGVQRLGAAEHGGERLDRGAHDVVVGVLLGQADARGLAVGAQARARRLGRLERRHQLGPQQPRGAQLGDLHEEVHADAEEERQARREGVDRDPGRQRGANVLDAIGERERQLLHRGRAGLLHVIAGDRDRVELRHVLRGVADDVGDDAHARFGRVDIRVPNHELLEDVVLDRARQLGLIDALLLARDDEAGEHRQHRAVHGHRHAHLVERDTGEQDLHVLDRVDRDPGLADVADHALVVAVVAAVGRQVEGDRQAHLSGLERGAVERVRFLGGREAGILADRPRPIGVHGGARPADVRRETRQPADGLEALEVGGGVERLDRDALGRAPVQARRVGAGQLLGHQGLPRCQAGLFGLGHGGVSSQPVPRE